MKKSRRMKPQKRHKTKNKDEDADKGCRFEKGISLPRCFRTEY
uniref:Uncharacterized protein n=1 Tax=Ciona intestinalis TaxID=7719 RepID=H2Y1W3_CIOIN